MKKHCFLGLKTIHLVFFFEENETFLTVVDSKSKHKLQLASDDASDLNYVHFLRSIPHVYLRLIIRL